MGCGASRTSPADSPPKPDAVAEMRADMAALRERNLQLEAQMSKLRESRPSTDSSDAGDGTRVEPLRMGEAKDEGRRRRVSVLSDGTRVNMSRTDLRVMRDIFNVFDTNKSGLIEPGELSALHAKLGEPISEEEARKVVRDLGWGVGGISFENFVKLWDNEHSTKFAKSHYAARFQFMKAKVAHPDVAAIYTESAGEFPSLEYRVKFFAKEPEAKEAVQISPWHDIPLRNKDGSFNFICEIPKWTRAKMEIATGEPFNPIKQDTKNGRLRDYKWGDMFFNYGAFPQTWEDPDHVSIDTGAKGDNDPLDVIEIGSKQWSCGSVVHVKILGVLAMIDEGETDWKVIVINVQDPLASKMNDVEDVHTHIPGAIPAIHKWLKLYKSPTINEFAFGGKCKGRDYAISIIEETHRYWKNLIKRRGDAATV